MKLLIAFDVSGSFVSMPYELLRRERLRLEARVQNLGADEIFYVCFDASGVPQPVTHAEVIDLIEKIYRLVEIGRGAGGSGDTKFLYVKATAMRADAILFVTDGMIDYEKHTATQHTFLVEDQYDEQRRTRQLG